MIKLPILWLVLFYWLMFPLTGAQAQPSFTSLNSQLNPSPLLQTGSYPSRFFLNNVSFTSANKAAFRPGETKSNIDQFGLDIKTTKVTGQGNNFIVDGEAFYSLAEERAYINPRELHYSYKSQNNIFSFGRKRVLWSRMDNEWQQSVWQPVSGWDRIHLEQQGLFGFFNESKINNHWTLTLFASPIYIPEIDQRKDLEDGRFVAVNPWSRPPTRNVAIPPITDEAEIYYEIKDDDIEDIVLNESIAVNASWSKGGNHCSLSYAYKPMNTLMKNLDLVVRLDLENAPPGVMVYPEVWYHHLGSVECGQELSSRSRYWLSYTHESPQGDVEAGKDISQQVATANIISGKYSYDLAGEDDFATQVYISFFQVTGGNASDKGSLAVAGVENSFIGEKPYKYYQSARIGFAKPFGRLFNKRYLLDVSATYAFKQRGGILSSTFSVAYDPDISLFAGYDLIGYLDSAQPEIDDGLVREYNANDQFRMGMSYVF